MPQIIRSDSHTGITAEHERKLRRHAPVASGGFDPNENPVIIGSGATAGGGSTPSAVSAGTAGATVLGALANGHAVASVVVVGNDADAYAAYDVSIGYQALANGSKAVAIGYQAKAGFSSSVGKTSPIAIGDSSIASADYAIAIGLGAHATGSDSVAIGHGATVSAASTIVLGTTSHTTAIPGTTRPSKLDASLLPTSDPLVSGLVWSNAGVLTVSP